MLASVRAVCTAVGIAQYLILQSGIAKGGNKDRYWLSGHCACDILDKALEDDAGSDMTLLVISVLHKSPSLRLHDDAHGCAHYM